VRHPTTTADTNQINLRRVERMIQLTLRLTDPALLTPNETGAGSRRSLEPACSAWSLWQVPLCKASNGNPVRRPFPGIELSQVRCILLCQDLARSKLLQLNESLAKTERLRNIARVRVAKYDYLESPVLATHYMFLSGVSFQITGNETPA